MHSVQQYLTRWLPWMRESHGRDRGRREEEEPAVGRRELERNSGKQEGVNQFYVVPQSYHV